jgi:hypothetical protein
MDMEVSILAGRRGEAYVNGRLVARIGQWDARAFPDGGWDGSCECEWYKGNDADAFRSLTAGGVDVELKLYDYNEVCYLGRAVAKPSGREAYIGDVISMELSLAGTEKLAKAPS